MAGVSIFGSHVEFRNLQVRWNVRPGANGVTLRNVVSDGPVFITGASNVSVLGGQVYSPVPVASDSQIASIQGKVPTNILIDGVAFHDFRDVVPATSTTSSVSRSGRRSISRFATRASATVRHTTSSSAPGGWPTTRPRRSRTSSSRAIRSPRPPAATTPVQFWTILDGPAPYLGPSSPSNTSTADDSRAGHAWNRSGALQLPAQHVGVLLRLIRSKGVVRLQRLPEQALCAGCTTR